jgi:hypothetical protein
MSEKYYARLCWNSSGWLHPTGEAAKLEGVGVSYATKNGFGHEEWLFNFGVSRDGYQYGFLQPVHRSWDGYAGRTIDVILWSIDFAGKRVFVGEIRNCQVLTAALSKDAGRYFKRVGWIRSMEADLKSIGLKDSKINEEVAFNVRFKPADATLYGHPFPVSASNPLQRVTRYLLTRATEFPSVPNDGEKLGSTAPHSLPSTKSYINPGYRGGTVERYHAQLQGELFKLLQSRYGKKSVEPEVSGVDIKVSGTTRTVIIELKTHLIAKKAIREALGQALEYGYFNPNAFPTKYVDLFIVAPAESNSACDRYLQTLRTKFALPIRYCTFRSRSGIPAELANLSL